MWATSFCTARVKCFKWRVSLKVWTLWYVIVLSSLYLVQGWTNDSIPFPICGAVTAALTLLSTKCVSTIHMQLQNSSLL